MDFAKKGLVIRGRIQITETGEYLPTAMQVTVAQQSPNMITPDFGPWLNQDIKAQHCLCFLSALQHKYMTKITATGNYKRVFQLLASLDAHLE